ncbi:MAG TPA: PEP-CTERM sorting domain-containing protein [Pyrinomonadaceae bacterium]|nr:PEP-CTERM sorting domain-containing protein [Pyrinomonadaceae bacterium]
MVFTGNRKEDDHTMKHQALRPIALMLSVLIIAAVPAQAGTVRFGDVISLATINGQSGRTNVDLRLRSVTQQSGGTAQQQRQTASTGNNSQDRKNVQTPAEGASPATNADTSITGTSVAVQQPGVQVETIELGDIQGTICDCPWPTPPGIGFPKLPFLALAGIPLLFLGGGSDTPPGDFVIIPPPPTPPPAPEIPEPATLLLLGSGLAALGAGARRRRHAAASARADEADTEVLDVRGA